MEPAIATNPTATTSANSTLGTPDSPTAAPTGRAFGIALYLDYTATPADWAAYRSDWLGPDITGR